MSLESVKMSDTITNISAEIEIEFSILSNRLACISSKKNKTKDRKFQSLAVNSMEN